eukprot:GSChrysophyteH1.ASY1.ANO1.2347.1 assembled CDS
MGWLRNSDDSDLPPLTEQVIVAGSAFWFGSQLTSVDGKLAPAVLSDGARLRTHVPLMQDFWMDIHSVTNKQFKAFVDATGYKTEAEVFQWSFVLDYEANAETRKEVDGPKGYGRVKTAPHWMAVKGATWRRPFGVKGKSVEELNRMNHPVVHVSYNDADEYCSWATVLRLPTEWEHEYAARGGLINQTFPWGDANPSSGKGQYVNNINIWHEKDPNDKFPTQCDASYDGYVGTAPVKSYAPNGYGIYNLVGNVWEWALGGTYERRVLRGASYVDSLDGRFNHLASVSTRQTNTGDSAASNAGFRCVGGGRLNEVRETQWRKKLEVQDRVDSEEREKRREERKLKHEKNRIATERDELIQKEIEEKIERQYQETREKEKKKQRMQKKQKRYVPLHEDVMATEPAVSRSKRKKKSAQGGTFSKESAQDSLEDDLVLEL